MMLGLVGAGGAALLGINFLVLPSLIHHQKVVVMPDVRGLSLEAASSQLKFLEISVTVSRQRAHPTIAEGLILDQIPGPQAQIRGGREARVITSSGPPATTVPQLMGLSQRQAEVTLQREGFKLGRVLRVRRPGVTESVVAFQSPGPGVMLFKGAVIDLVVAAKSAPQLVCMPDLADAPLVKAKQAIAVAGFVLAPVKYERTNRVAPNVVLEQHPPAGRRIREGEQIELVASSR